MINPFSDLSDQIQNALSIIVDGVCHPLKVRVETILNSEKNTIILFAISNLLRFYDNIISQVIQENTKKKKKILFINIQNLVFQVIKSGNLKQCLKDLQKYSESVYLNALSAQVKSLLQHPSQSINNGLELSQRDLIPLPSVGKLLNLLKEMLSVVSMIEGRQSDIKTIVSCVIDPLLQYVNESAAHLPTIDMAVYILNCLYHIQSTLTMFEYIEECIERIEAQSNAQLDTLTSEQASSLVANLNLGPIYTILQNNHKKLDINSLKIFINKLESFLEMPDLFLLPQINLLMSNAHRLTIQKRSFSVIVAIYEQIYQRIHDPNSGFDNPHLILIRTPAEISNVIPS